MHLAVSVIVTTLVDVYETKIRSNKSKQSHIKFNFVNHCSKPCSDRTLIRFPAPRSAAWVAIAVYPLPVSH